MAAYQYGVPQAGLAERPACWGNATVHDPTSRSCRGCGYQNSCRDDIIRLNNQRVAQPAPFYGPAVPQYSPPQPQAPAAPVYPNPYQTTPVAQQPTPVRPYQPYQAAPPQAQAYAARPQQPIPQPRNQYHNVTDELYGYGWIQDPLYYTIVATPPPVRPQLMGESFTERTVKNASLSMLETLFSQLFLAIRQLVLPPRDPNQK